METKRKNYFLGSHLYEILELEKLELIVSSLRTDVGMFKYHFKRLFSDNLVSFYSW
jgi:hypothetical protein